jgi:pyruvate dehydrogenase E2 component (dihydrolipoamide acetyltransferase)
MIEFTLPSLGADMDEGKLLEWKVKPGDTVKRGQVVAIVDTSKAAVDVEIWQDGTVHELIVQPGETVPVGTVLARLLAPGETPVAAPEKAAPQPAAAARRAVSPAARRRASELGVDADQLTGTGPGGAVTLDDVERAATAAPKNRQSEMRRAIGAAMSRSKREIPHYYLGDSVPMHHAQAWLEAANADKTITDRVLMAVLQLRAVALALKKYPDMNGFYREGRFQPVEAAHIGVAIALREGGLVAPALHDVDSKPMDQIMRELADLVKRARSGSLRSSEMSDPTITVTNLGDQGVEMVFGVIYPPQVALVGFGRIALRPWVDDAGTVRAVPMMAATLAADHRVSDGHRGALFLAEIRERLQHPETLWQEA